MKIPFIIISLLFSISTFGQNYSFNRVSSKLKKDKLSLELYKEYFTIYLFDRLIYSQLYDSTDFFLSYYISTYNEMRPFPRLVSRGAIEKSFIYQINISKTDLKKMAFHEISDILVHNRLKLKRSYKALVADFQNYNLDMFEQEDKKEEYFRKFILYYYINPETE